MTDLAPLTPAPLATRRTRRVRQYTGWRARLASWLRRLADLLNPLGAP